MEAFTTTLTLDKSLLGKEMVIVFMIWILRKAELETV